MSNSEKKILAKIRKWLGVCHAVYDFWFVYDKGGEAINWEGGAELSQSVRFRNQYTIISGDAYKYGKTIKNW